jgi:hypothetical protein
MSLFANLRHKVERRLYARGFASSTVRHLLTTQILLTGASLAVGILAAPFTLWPLAFGVGAAIAGFSLWHISRFAQANIQRQFSAALAIRLFAGFNARLVLIALVLFALIVWLRAPVAPLLLGLSSTVAGIVVWGIARLSRKTVKEA